MLINKPAIIRVPVKVDHFRWSRPVSGSLTTLKCTGCDAVLGTLPWGVVWIVGDEGEKRSLRLCFHCAKVASAEAPHVMYAEILSDYEKALQQ